jgi:hypothetical protein
MASTARLMEASFKAGRRVPRRRRTGPLGARGGRVGAGAVKAVPAKGRAAKGGAKASARAVRANAYLQALMHDRALRGNLEDAYGSLAKAYGRASKKDLGDALLDDRKTRRELRKATTSLRAASARLSAAKARRRRRGARVVVLVGLAGGVGALALSEDLRGRVFGLVSRDGGAPDHSSNGAGRTAAPQAATTSETATSA